MHLKLAAFHASLIVYYKKVYLILHDHVPLMLHNKIKNNIMGHQGVPFL